MTFGELLNPNLVDLTAGTFQEQVTSIGIVMSHCAEITAAILAVLKCGAEYVLAEPNFPIGRIHYMMKEANVDFILTEISFANELDSQKKCVLETVSNIYYTFILVKNLYSC